MIRVVLALTALAVSTLPGTGGAVGAGGHAHGMRDGTIDMPLKCTEVVPEPLSRTGVTDHGRVVPLDVLVVLDGLPRQLAASVMATADRAYAPLKVRLVPRYLPTSFAHDGMHVPDVGGPPVPTADEQRLFREMIEMLDGQRPDDIDVVLLLTDKDIFYQSAGQRMYGSGGIAACIGGVEYADKAFAIAEGWRRPGGDATYPAKVVAHELGHLMGAHHHYSNCVEGDGTMRAGLPGVCTLMEGSLTRLVSARFGTVESAAIRGHAVRFADRS